MNAINRPTGGQCGRLRHLQGERISVSTAIKLACSYGRGHRRTRTWSECQIARRVNARSLGEASSRRDDAMHMLSKAKHFKPRDSLGASEDHVAGIEPTEGPSDWLARDVSLRNSCEAEKSLTVAVLLSGGVDSSLALNLAVAAGHKVTAFYLQIWFQEDFRNYWDACPWEEDLRFAQQVCDAADVPLEVVPLTEEYWNKVVGHSVTAIRKGLTPNPDILCNSRIKFGAFHDYLESKYPGIFDRIVSGHYARLDRPEYRFSKSGCEGAACAEVILRATPDEVKDQTYFLAQLSQAQIARSMFPLGPLTKADVRKMAAAAGLATQGRKDSQGICFLGKVKFSEFLKEHLGEWPGPILEEETNRLLGFHRGFWFHTIGQRSGLLLADGPCFGVNAAAEHAARARYVAKKDIVWNVVYASKHYYDDSKTRRSFRCSRFNWLYGAPPDQNNGQIQCKVRHGPTIYNCNIESQDCDISVTLDRDDQGLAPGQYTVFYQNGICFGSGIIQSSS